MTHPALVHGGVDTQKVDDWRTVADLIAQIAANADWWLGDIAAAAPSIEARTEWVNMHPSLDTARIGRAIDVAGRFPLTTRRRTDVPFEHHAEVWNVKPASHADRLLAEAAETECSVQAVRQAVARARRERAKT